MILVSGTAGVGKTTLTEEFCARAQREGAAPLIGRCDPDPTANYQPVVEILRSRRAARPSAASALPSALALCFPRARRPRSTAGGRIEGAQFRLFEAIATTIATLVPRPGVLVVEDLHWADRPTLRLIRHLVVIRSSTACS